MVNAKKFPQRHCIGCGEMKNKKEMIRILKTPEGEIQVPIREGKAALTLSNPRPWSPEDPYLYEAVVQAGQDRVESYFAFRTLDIKTVDGMPRLCLNGKPYFLPWRSGPGLLERRPLDTGRPQVL